MVDLKIISFDNCLIQLVFNQPELALHYLYLLGLLFVILTYEFELFRSHQVVLLALETIPSKFLRVLCECADLQCKIVKFSKSKVNYILSILDLV